jgi:2-keto-4-pentenoate hydratase/2-oxohepta-3-ene-1,7-dioic acid hydratase in catechol pathway
MQRKGETMRYLTYHSGQEKRLGVLVEGYIVDLAQMVGFGDLLELIVAGPETWKAVAAKVKGLELAEIAAKIPFEEALIATPIARPPKNMICLGRNYYKHYLEGAIARGEVEHPPEAPIYFTKPHTSLIGAYDAIGADPEVTTRLDWEAELGVIIGVGGRKIKPEQALEHVFGYTVINDVSARDLQSRHQQWFKGKSLDASCPVGPVVVTPEELPDPLHLDVSLKVNGELKQRGNTRQMMFDVATIIADLSLSITLEPGDIISTGTPEGVGQFRQPPEFLKPGDVMETEIELIGVLRNRIVTVE